MRRVSLALAWRPEWPLVVLVALAWVTLIVVPGGHSGYAGHGVPGGDAGHGGHAEPGAAALAATAATAPGSATLAAAVGVPAVLSWTVMSVAMMVPVAMPAARHVGLNSIRRRRRWAVALFCASYVGVWVAFGVAALGLLWALRSAGLHPALLLGVTLLVAALWQVTRWKRRSVVACQRTVPLPPFGWRADTGCVRFGVRQGQRCLISCWPLMLLMAVIGHGVLFVMAALTAGIVAERYLPTGKYSAIPVLGALAATVVWVLLTA